MYIVQQGREGRGGEGRGGQLEHVAHSKGSLKFRILV